MLVWETLLVISGRVRVGIISHFGVLRHPSGKARGLRILLCVKDEQRRKTGWIDAPKWEVILGRTLSANGSVITELRTISLTCYNLAWPLLRGSVL